LRAILKTATPTPPKQTAPQLPGPAFGRLPLKLDDAFYQLEKITGSPLDTETLRLLIERTLEFAKAHQKGT